MSMYLNNMFFTSLIIALLFAAIFLFGGRLAYRPGQRGHRRFLSFAAGIAVAYVFVDVMPALGRMRDIVMQSQSDFYRVFPEYSVYLWTMAGFLAFYSLQTLVTGPRRDPKNHVGDHEGAAPWQMWVHIVGFTLYAWLLTYIMVWKVHDPLALCLYGVAMGMHIFPIACNLSNHYQELYDRRGAFLLALASLAGWATGLLLDIPTPILVNLVAIVAGGVIVNSSIDELPKEKEGRFWSFLAGALVYTAVLLALSHFEKGG
jgi:Kef-type K+ transport system membrane component KefB